MIMKLNKHQKEQINVYLDKWLKIGLRTERIDKNKAIEAANFFYRDILGKETPEIIILDSPMACQIELNKNSQLDSQLRSQLHSQLRSQLDSQLRSQLRSQLHSQLRSQ